MKKYRLKRWVKNVLILSLFYLFIIGSVIVANARFEQIKSADSHQLTAQNK